MSQDIQRERALVGAPLVGPASLARTVERPGRPASSFRRALAAEFWRWWRTAQRTLSGLVSSGVLHLVLLLALSYWLTQPGPQRPGGLLITHSRQSEVPELEATLDLAQDGFPTDLEVDPERVAQIAASNPAEGADISLARELSAAASAPVTVVDPLLDTIPRNDLLRETGSLAGNDLRGRGEAARQALVRQRGGNAASEEAVGRGLEWLARHQLSNGSWSFDHTAACRGQCANPGSKADCTNAATGLALLPFLGAGQTPYEGKYRLTVQAGLKFLTRQIEPLDRKQELGSFMQKAAMYDHGLCTIALCEALAMTRDRVLERPAQMALNFISVAQDPVGGGWRYRPGDPGDTSQHGWQVMALKSGYLAYLNVPPTTIARASQFLDSMQSSDGITYGYTGPDTVVMGRSGEGSMRATTAAALLCRMYLGWQRDDPRLVAGCEYLAAEGPSDYDMYFNYYATQVLSHFEGPLWEAWNRQMRDQLVAAQSQKGHQTGSWFFPGSDRGHDHGLTPGGRLYFTAMSTLTLEVYYRYLPLYRKDAIDIQFQQNAQAEADQPHDADTAVGDTVTDGTAANGAAATGAAGGPAAAPAGAAHDDAAPTAPATADDSAVEGVSAAEAGPKRNPQR